MPAAHSFAFLKSAGNLFVKRWAHTYLQLRSWVPLAANINDGRGYPTGETNLGAFGQTLLQDAPGFVTTKVEFLQWIKNINDTKWDNLANDSWFGLLRGFGTILWSVRSGRSTYHARAAKM